jgi:L-fuconolactonase
MLSVPAIDAHTHALGDAADATLPPQLFALGPAFEPEDLRPWLEEEGISGVLVVQAQPGMAETRRLLALAERVPFVVGVVGWVDLVGPGVRAAIDELRAAPGGGHLVGVQHQVREEPDPRWLARDDVRRGLVAVEAAGLAFDLVVTTRELPAATELAARLPGLRLVLDHLARPPIASGALSAWGSALLALAEHPNVSAKLSGLVTEADWEAWSIDDLRHPVELALDAFGAERLMLGSEWPVCLLAGTYGDTIGALRYLVEELPAHQKADIEGGTAARVYGLGRREPGTAGAGSA